MRKRKLNRKRGYDYSDMGVYFVTVCVKNMNRVFGEIHNGLMILNEWGRIADSFWGEIPAYYKNIILDEYVIMPDHIHGIIWIEESEYNGYVRTEHCSVRTSIDAQNQTPLTGKPNYGQLSKIIKSFKNAVTKKYREIGNADFQWHRSFHDRIIRNENELKKIRQYIANNTLEVRLSCPIISTE